MKRGAIVLMLLALTAFASAQGEGSKGILYRVDGGKNPMYLLGSIHVGMNEMYPFGENISNAVEASDCFVFECDMQNPLALLLLQKEARYGAGDSLRCHISEETLQMLENYATQSGFRLNVMLSYKPWALMNLLMPEMVSLLLEGADGTMAMQNGVDTVLASQVRGKQAAYLEEVQDQLNALNSLSDSLQEDMLRETLQLLMGESDPEGVNADMIHWGEWWKNGDTRSFAASYRNTRGAEANEEYIRVMLTERNDKMASVLAEMLESGEPHRYFVTLGLMHLVMDEDSILTRLKQGGYQVTQLR